MKREGIESFTAPPVAGTSYRNILSSNYHHRNSLCTFIISIFQEIKNLQKGKYANIPFSEETKQKS